MGAVIAGSPRDACIEALDRYGKAVGLAFQIVDDLLDVQGDEAKLGKRVGKDSELGKWTYPRFLGVDGSRRRARQLADEAVAALEPLRPARRPAARPGAGSFGKGSLMNHPDSVLVENPIAGRPEGLCRKPSSSSSPPRCAPS